MKFVFSIALWALPLPLLSQTPSQLRMQPIRGNVRPLLSQYQDQGPAARSLTLSGATLHLNPTPAQSADLHQLLAQLQNPQSPQYHHWLTPEQYADRFGATPAEIQSISQWLISQGLTVQSQGRGRDFVTFSGTVAQVEAVSRSVNSLSFCCSG